MDIEQARKLIESKIKKRGYQIFYRTSNSGCVFEKSKKCFIPKARGRSSLYLICHELFHTLRDKPSSIKTYINEMLAEKFAMRYMQHLGFSVPRKHITRAKRYISWKILKAQRRGLKRIDPKVKKWL